MEYRNTSIARPRWARPFGVLAAAVCAVASLCPPAAAQSALQAPTEQEQAIIQQIDFEQKLDDQIPLDATFTDEDGKQVQLHQLFSTGRPVVVTLVYYECPMLCTEVLNGLLATMKEMGDDFTAGKQFDVVTISIDPGETPALAAEKRGEYLRRYGRDVPAASWHFLVGTKPEIDKVADAIGYKYVYDKVTDQYAHPSGIVVATPSGKISRYFFGVQYAQRDVRLGLVEASSNKIGSPTDKILLYCFHYDPLTGKYNVAVMNFIRLFGVVTVIAMALAIFYLLRREKAAKPGAASPV